MKHIRLALGFLTIIPVNTQDSGPDSLGRAAAWFPLVGLLLGAALAVAHFFLSQTFAPLLAAALTVALWAALTGGLHLDGLADCCDGLLASATPERRLEIMRDPRLGTFGVAGLILFLILKILAVAYLLPSFYPPFPLNFFPNLIAPFALTAVLARWLILVVARQRPARPEGLGNAFAAGLTPAIIVLAAILPVALVAGLCYFALDSQLLQFDLWRVLRATLFAHLIAFAVIGLARARLGGVTGDVLGLTVELVELTVLLAFAANSPSLGI